MKCFNRCADLAETNLTWPTSRGAMSVNFCGCCSADWWNKYKNTPAGQGVILGPVKSAGELRSVCAEYAGGAL